MLNKIIIKRRRACWRILLLAGLVLLVFSISGFPDQRNVLDRITQLSSPVPKQAPAGSDSHLPDQVVPVQAEYPGGVFWTESRKNQMERYPCYACHTGKPRKETISKDLAHGTVRIEHGTGDKALSCATCHVQDRPHLLRTEDQKDIDMDHSYDLCGQCHFRQKQDWVGGAHGKRVSNWAGKRVVKNCTACHNPHAPLFKKRWPATYSPPTDR